MRPIQLVDLLRIKLEYSKINYDEKKIPRYTLPDPLKMVNGTIVTCPDEWWEKRRPEIVRLFQEYIYGRSPQYYKARQSYHLSCDPNALSGLATRKKLTIFLTDQSEGHHIHLLLYVPNHAYKPVPTFLGLNFYGNHTIHPDTGISITRQWQQKNRNGPLVYIFPSEKARGSMARRWPVEKILQHGYGLATAYYGDLEPDFLGGYRYGVRSIFLNSSQRKDPFEKDVNARKSEESEDVSVWNVVNGWSAIGAWAWGLSRIMDYLECDSDINASQVVLFGHSRLGKAALWAGAQDDRFAIVISNDSGCGGTALFRRRFGETIKLLNLVRPHWFSKNFKNFNNKENKLPVDQHMLIALMAPRPVYVASAEKDLASDPLGEFLSAKNADSVYNLLGLTGVGVDQMPILNEPVGKTIGYHIRAGEHDITYYDWEQFFRFANRQFEKCP